MLMKKPSEGTVKRESASKPLKKPETDWKMFGLGLGLTIVLGTMAFLLAPLPGLTMMGSLTIALILGLAWRMSFSLPQKLRGGVRFSTQKVLRYGIILTVVNLVRRCSKS